MAGGSSRERVDAVASGRLSDAPQLAALTTPVEAAGIGEKIVGALLWIDERYRDDVDLAIDEQIPFVVFERLVERVAEVACAVASFALYKALRDLPREVLGRDKALTEVQARLLASSDDVWREDEGLFLMRHTLWLDAGDLETARNEADEAMRHMPGSQAVRRAQAVTAARARDDLAALAMLDTLLQTAPKDSTGLLERARLRLRYFHVAEAAQDLERLVEVADDSATQLFVATQFFMLGRWSDACSAARRATGVEASLIEALAEQELGNPLGAKAALQTAQRLAQEERPPPGVQANLDKALGDVAASEGAWAAALEHYLRAISTVGATYELSRAVAKAAWDQARAATPSQREDERVWLEANMEAELADGRPIEVSSADLRAAPYLERLPWWTVVERLVLGCGRRDNREALMQLFRLDLPHLRRLELWAEHFGFPCLMRLTQAPFFQRLEELVLRDCDLDEASLRCLLERLPPGLRELRILTADARPKLPREVALGEVLQTMRAPVLDTLELSSCALSAKDTLSLASNESLRLSTLVLTGNELHDLDASQFLAGPALRNVVELAIGDSGAERRVVEAVLAHPGEGALRRLWAQGTWDPGEARTLRERAAGRLDVLVLGVPVVSEEAWLATMEE